MSEETIPGIEELRALPLEQRAAPLAEWSRSVLAYHPRNEATDAIPLLLQIVHEGLGNRSDRVKIGEALALLGDPRLRDPEEDGYWVRVSIRTGVTTVGRYMVTNHEYQRFVRDGGYENREWWGDDGWAWLSACEDPWPVREAHVTAHFLVANQPVVGVNWYEARAYARAHGARLPKFDERLWVVRGKEKRPYPWGAPFGEGNANTREEVLGRPVAVGLYVQDRTPEGVCDLAGNVAEWMADGIGSERWIHPGAWDQPSMAAWAKARSLEPPEARWAGLGFRISRD